MFNVKTPLFIISLILLLGVLFSNCSQVGESSYDSVYLDYNYQKLGYHFFEPDDQTSLHNDLREISGLAMVDDMTLTAVEDERGYLYLISAKDGRMMSKIKFGKRGDYEGVEVIGSKVYVMKSNGKLYSFDLTDNDQVEAQETETTFSSKNDVEGLAYNGQFLLIACKGSGDIDGNKVKGKGVYQYYLQSAKTVTNELVDIEKGDLEDFIKSRAFFNRIDDFDPSAIAVHPITHDIYILSADKVLVILTPEYQLKEVVKLDPRIYRQPEGMCFASDGTLFIANEGDGGRGRLIKLLFNTAKN